MRLLICEDEQAIREGLVETIDWKSLGIDEIMTACNGTEAVNSFTDALPDIILTDIRMPEMDGLALCQYVYENHPQVKLIILSGYGDFEYAQRAIRYEVVNYFLKPVPINDLTELIGKLTQQIKDAKQEESPELIGNRSSDLLTARVQEFIAEHYSEAINIDSIARELKKNPSYLSHQFKSQMGINCSEYLNQVRIEQASRLLKATDDTLDEIAEKTGFSSSAYLITVFKRMKGMTPAKYRKNS